MGRCDYCGKETAMPYKCRRCGVYFCADHRLPENHHCPGIYRRRKTLRFVKTEPSQKRADIEAMSTERSAFRETAEEAKSNEFINSQPVGTTLKDEQEVELSNMLDTDPQELAIDIPKLRPNKVKEAAEARKEEVPLDYSIGKAEKNYYKSRSSSYHRKVKKISPRYNSNYSTLKFPHFFVTVLGISTES